MSQQENIEQQEQEIEQQQKPIHELIADRKENKKRNGVVWPFHELTELGHNFRYECDANDDIEKIRVNLAVLSNYHNKKRTDDLRYVVRKTILRDDDYYPLCHVAFDEEGKEVRGNPMVLFHVLLVDKSHIIYNKKDKSKNQ